jgi:hypothetical protein
MVNCNTRRETLNTKECVLSACVRIVYHLFTGSKASSVVAIPVVGTKFRAEDILHKGALMPGQHHTRYPISSESSRKAFSSKEEEEQLGSTINSKQFSRLMHQSKISPRQVERHLAVATPSAPRSPLKARLKAIKEGPSNSMNSFWSCSYTFCQ